MKDNLERIHYDALYARENLKGQQLLNTLRKLETNLNKIGIQKSDNLFFRVLGQGKNDIMQFIEKHKKSNQK